MTLAASSNMVSVVSSSVLVLNRFYMAVHVVNVRRAIALLFRDLAEVIHIEDNRYANYDFVSWQEISALRAEYEVREPDEDWIRSVNFQLQVPRIIRLLNTSLALPNSSATFIPIYAFPVTLFIAFPLVAKIIVKSAS